MNSAFVIDPVRTVTSSLPELPHPLAARSVASVVMSTQNPLIVKTASLIRGQPNKVRSTMPDRWARTVKPMLRGLLAEREIRETENARFRAFDFSSFWNLQVKRPIVQCPDHEVGSKYTE